jgi:hypothetical protein
MLDSKTIFGLLTLPIGVISYVNYFVSIFKGRTKPEAFSWLIWSVLASITFFAQIAEGAGAGAWATGFTALVCLLISLTAFFKTRNKIKVIDWISMIGALSGLILWRYTSQPLVAVIFVVIVGIIGFVPTFIKIFVNPAEETALTYFLNAVKFVFALLATNSFNFVTALYPSALVFMNIFLVSAILFRRRFLSGLA